MGLLDNLGNLNNLKNQLIPGGGSHGTPGPEADPVTPAPAPPAPAGIHISLQLANQEVLNDGSLQGTASITSETPQTIQGLQLMILQKRFAGARFIPNMPPPTGPDERLWAQTSVAAAFNLTPGQPLQIPFQFTFNKPFGAPMKPAVATPAPTTFLGKAVEFAEGAAKPDPNHQWDFFLDAHAVVNGQPLGACDDVQLWGKPF